MLFINLFPLFFRYIHNISILVNEKSFSFAFLPFCCLEVLHSYLPETRFVQTHYSFSRVTDVTETQANRELSLELFHKVVHPIPENLQYLSSSHRAGFLPVSFYSNAKERRKIWNAASLKSNILRPLYSSLTDIMTHKAVDVSFLCLIWVVTLVFACSVISNLSFLSLIALF